PLYEREVGIVRYDRLRERGELHALSTELDDLPNDPLHGAFAAVEHGADLYSGGLDGHHVHLLRGVDRRKLCTMPRRVREPPGWRWIASAGRCAPTERRQCRRSGSGAWRRWRPALRALGHFTVRAAPR